MKVLLCHNHYQQPGGEDQSFAAEAHLLESHGHQVIPFTRHNADIDRMTRWEVSRRTLWNGETYADLRKLIRRQRPDIMHCTNIFPLISPAAYYAAHAEGLTVVQSLRNYRLFCSNAMLLRAGRVCETCLGEFVPWAGIVHGCYRQSRAGSAVVAAMLGVHRAMKTWTRAVDLYFTVTEFARQKFVEGGLPAERIAVKPNFVDPDPGPGRGRGGYAAFVGRLAPEKGVDTLLEAWARLRGRLPLKIVGDGPLSERVRTAAKRDPSIEWLGRRPLAELLSITGEAVCLVMPSIWYETFGRVIIEAFAKGTPVVVSRMGAMAELVEDGFTGVHFQPGNPHDLAAKVQELSADPIKLGRMRAAARGVYELRYTAEHNYRLLISLYEQAQTARSRRWDGRAA